MTMTTAEPTITPVSEPYWTSLRCGRLKFQSCSCGHKWLPPRAECPSCLNTDWQWVEAEGTGKLISWVVYHVAYHASLNDRLPYNVALVELDEGPRLITNILDASDGRGLSGDAPVVLDTGATKACQRSQFRLEHQPANANLT